MKTAATILLAVILLSSLARGDTLIVANEFIQFQSIGTGATDNSSNPDDENIGLGGHHHDDLVGATLFLGNSPDGVFSFDLTMDLYGINYGPPGNDPPLQILETTISGELFQGVSTFDYQPVLVVNPSEEIVFSNPVYEPSGDVFIFVESFNVFVPEPSSIILAALGLAALLAYRWRR